MRRFNAILPIAPSQPNTDASNTTPRRRALCARPGRSVSRVCGTLTVRQAGRSAHLADIVSRETNTLPNPAGCFVEVLARSGGWRVVAGSIPARLNGQPGETGKAPYQLDDMVVLLSHLLSSRVEARALSRPPWWVQLPPGWTAKPVIGSLASSGQGKPGASPGVDRPGARRKTRWRQETGR